MISFKNKEDGSFEAEEGMYDDRVMSIAIAKYVRKTLPLPAMKATKSENSFGDYAWAAVGLPAAPPVSSLAWT